jgi:hypoxanthine phosphoribosyltransferase
LSYAIKELEKDVAEQSKLNGRENEKTTFGIFVLHNKNKPKKGTLPEEIVQERYWAAEQIPDLWVRSNPP